VGRRKVRFSLGFSHGSVLDIGRSVPQFAAMFMLLAAAQLASPAPIHFEDWFGSYDYPSDLFDENRGTAFQAPTQTLVDSAGKTFGCRVETPSGSPQVDALACAIILKKGRFEPARWSDGSPVPGLHRQVISFGFFGDQQPILSDVEVEVASLPPGTKSPAFVRVAFASEADGKITDCRGDPPAWVKIKPPDPSLFSVACSVVRAQWKPFTVLDPSGKPTRSVQTASVKFTVPKRR